MQYFNPLSTLNISLKKIGQNSDKEFLKREKKRLLAEFELNDTPTISLKGKKLDKTAVLNLFEQMEDNEVLAHHTEIYKRPLLLSFLEDGSLSYYQKKQRPDFNDEPKAFVEFLAPYFANQFNRLLLKSFKQKNWELIESMVSGPFPLPSKYQVETYKDTLQYIHSQVIEIEGLAASIAGGKKPDGQVQEICDEFLISSLNELPDYFAGVRDRYGLSLEALALAVHNTHQRVDLGILILKQGLKLNISDSTHGRLKYVLDQLLAMSPSETTFDFFSSTEEKKNSNALWIALGVGAAVILFILL